METILKKFIVIVVIPTIILFGELADTVLFQNIEKSLEMKEKIKQMAFYECIYYDFDFDEVTVYDDPEEKGCYYIGFSYDVYYYWFDSNTEMLYLCTMKRGEDVPFEPTMDRIINKKGDSGLKISGYHEDKFPWRDVVSIAHTYATNGYGNISIEHPKDVELFSHEIVQTRPREIIEIWNMGGPTLEPPWETYRIGGGLLGKYEFNGLTGELKLQCADYHFYRGCHEDLNQLIIQCDRENIPTLGYNLYSVAAIEYWAKKNIKHSEQTVFYTTTDPLYSNCFFISMADNEIELYQRQDVENTKSRVVYWLDGRNYKLYLVDQTDPYDLNEKGRELVQEINREEMDKQIKEMYDTRVIWKEQK